MASPAHAGGEVTTVLSLSMVSTCHIHNYSHTFHNPSLRTRIVSHPLTRTHAHIISRTHTPSPRTHTPFLAPTHHPLAPTHHPSHTHTIPRTHTPSPRAHTPSLAPWQSLQYAATRRCRHKPDPPHSRQYLHVTRVKPLIL